MYHVSRTAAVIAFVIASVLGIGALVALAQSTQSVQRAIGGIRATTPAAPAVTPPPLPLGDRSRLPSDRRSLSDPRSAANVLSTLSRLTVSGHAVSQLQPYTGPRPPIPKLTELLHHHHRVAHSASGASVVLTGPLGVAYLEDSTVAYGALVGWVCENLTPSTTYQYVVFSPDGYAAVVKPFKQSSNSNVATFTTDTQGRCIDTSNFAYYAFIPLSTPMLNGPGGGNNPDPITAVGPLRGGAAGSDAPYSGVWAIAVKNTTTGNFEAVAYSVVLGTLNFNTYSDPGFSTRAADYASGANVYVSASGLNPAHFYAFGFVNTSGNGLPCVYTIPSAAQNNANATCFLQGTSGVLPTGGKLTGVFPSPSNGANSVGTYSVQLFDVTTSDLISTQQISLNPATVTWSALVPYNGATTGANVADTFAVDGILNNNTGAPAVVEQSVQGLTYAAAGLTTGHNYRITVSNPNGVVMNSTTTDPQQQAFAPLPTYAAVGGALPATKVNFPLNTTTITSLGQAQTPFAPNVYTAQLYDTTAGAVVGSKSFRMLSYAGALRWTAPGGLFVNANTTATNVTTTVQNTAGIFYGAWNADGIAKITITSDASNFVTLGLQGGVTTTTDSAGNTWTITNPNARTIIVTPNVAGTSLPANGTVPVPMTVADAGVKCGAGCTLETSILPAHGILSSITNAAMANTATNGLLVFAAGSGGTLPTYSIAVGAYSGPQLGTPRYPQMMYRTGTNGASGGTYTLTFTINNSGATQALESAEFALPPGFDVQLTPPTLTKIIVNGVDQTANWSIQAPNPFGGIGTGCDPAVNDFGITTTKNAATLPKNKIAVVTIAIPILPTAFPFEEISGTANYCDSAAIGGTSYQLGQTNTLTNAVAGTQNIDSTELGVFSLDTALMSATINPSTIAAMAGAAPILKFINTSTGLDPNPDYVNQLTFSIGAGAIPTSVTVTSLNQVGVTWYANPTGTLGQWRVELCTPGPAPCAGTTDSNALPPGAELDVKFNYAVAPSIGTYPIAWSVQGANGGAIATASAAQQPKLIVANTTAETSFTFAGGYSATPSYPPATPPFTVNPPKTQPAVGSWSNFANGNGFVYELHNNGSTPITDITVAIPSSNTSGQITDAQDWQVIASSVYVYGAGAQGAQCSANGYKSLTQPARGSPGTYGLLMLSGCNVPLNGRIDIFFYALSPYDNGSNFFFPASVADNGIPPDPRPPATPNTLPEWPQATTMHIATDAQLAIQIPVAGNTYNPALFGGSTPGLTATCPGCVYNSSTLVPVINLGSFTGTFTASDVLAATVYSDDSNGWNLSVSADVNPAPNGGQVSTWIDSAASTALAGYTQSVTSAPGVIIPTVGTAALSAFNGTVRHQPIDNIMNYKITVGPTVSGASQTQTVTIKYTLVGN